MSDSVALVAVERVVRRIRGEVSANPKLVQSISTSREITLEQATEVVLTSAARKALSFAKKDEERAVNALVIVNGQVNRLPQCAKLLRKHDLAVVKVAYRIKEDLAVADTSLRVLCQFIEHTDQDIEGEASRLRGLLEEIAIQAVSDKQQWFLYHRITEMLNGGHMLEVIEDEILERLEHPFDAPTHSGV